MSNTYGRCGEKFGGRCNRVLSNYAVYCNENNGHCGNTNAHRDATAGAKYDYIPASCENPSK